MATLTFTNTFVNGTAAVATEVNANFNDVKTFVEATTAGTNIDSGAIAYSQIATAAVTSITNDVIASASSSDQTVLGSQIFG
jgi:hypothetical protein